MSRTRLYANDAERQKAYRLRQTAAQRSPKQQAPVRPSRRPSRPARLAALQVEASKLRDEYEGWLENLPESLAESDQANLLTEAVEQLQSVVDLLSEIQVPRGFGRD